MNVRHIFLSDVHYGAFDDETNHELGRDLIRLIDFCSENHIRLHILGDLFDYWMEYPGQFPDIGAHILEKFKVYFAKAGSVLYITGNHDNWTRGYFDKLGFDVESEYRILRLDGNSVLLHHGDGFDNKNMKLPRPWLHRLLRNKYFIKIYQFLLPPKKGLKLMKNFSDHCRKRPVAGAERLNIWAKDYLSKNDIDFVICGHDHIPRIETFPFGTYINSGTFYSHRTVVIYTNGDFKLVRWNSTQNTLTPFKEESNLIQHEQLYGT